jgi:hypothetical protein
MRIPVDEVPLQFRRRAAQRVENIHGSGVPQRELLRLGPEACAIHRPDLPEIAYYEFDVQWARPSGSGSPQRQGFVLASTGGHDFPIPDWSLERRAPSRELEHEAKVAGKELAKVFRLDAMAYVGQSDDGEVAAILGHILPGESWSKLLEGYGESYGAASESLRRQAAPEWETERILEEFGRGLRGGESYRVALLKPQASVEVAGPGAAFVAPEILEREGMASAVELSVSDPMSNVQAEFDLHIHYADGEKETLRFFVAGRLISTEDRAGPDKKSLFRE